MNLNIFGIGRTRLVNFSTFGKLKTIIQMGEFIKIGEIDSALCDKCLLDSFSYLNYLIETKKYQEIRSKIIASQFNYLDQLKNQKSYYDPPQSDFYIFDYELAENIIELMSNYNITLTNEGMCNLMNYIFYDVYCTKKSLPPHYNNAKPIFDKEYEGSYNPNYLASNWYWHKNTVFEGINEYVSYEVDARKFWRNFAQELLQKLGSTYFSLITHDGYEKNIFESYEDNFFIVKTHNFTNAEEPWYELNAFSRILETDDENAINLSGKVFTNYLWSSNPLPDFYKSETGEWKPDSGENIYFPMHRKTYGVFQKLKELGVSTNKILSGTVSILQNPNL
jgi:hypothetical protein